MVPKAQNNSSSLLDQIISQFCETVSQSQSLLEKLSDFEDIPTSATVTLINAILPTLRWHHWGVEHPEYKDEVLHYPALIKAITALHDCLQPLLTQEEKLVATEPIPKPSKLSYSSIGCSVNATHFPSTPPLNPSHSPKPKPGTRPPKPHLPDKAHPPTPRPRSHQVRSHVRLVACIAGRPDALTTETPRWKTVPTDCFSSLNDNSSKRRFSFSDNRLPSNPGSTNLPSLPDILEMGPAAISPRWTFKPHS
ncbi:hypothetical protein FRC11_003637, partial [Ceratobasidium sp. 423]